MNTGSLILLLVASYDATWCNGLAPHSTRRSAFGLIGGACVGCITTSGAIAADTPDGVDVNNYIRTGMVSMPMGVSGQAGKSKPVTGVVLRDGSEVNRDSRSGDVLAEILVKGSGNSDMMPVVATFSSPWPLATGNLFDVECRDSKTGDGAFLAVTSDVGGKSLADLKDSFFSKSIFSSTGRFSFYGQPTDIKLKTSEVKGDYRIMDISFSTLSQSTQTEIPRKGRVIATIPSGSSQAVMLVGSASAIRWKKGSDKLVASTMDSFKAVAAPQTSLRMRAS